MKFQTESRSHITRQTDLKLAVPGLLLWQITNSNKLCSGQRQLLCAISFYYISPVCVCVCVFLFPTVFCFYFFFVDFASCVESFYILISQPGRRASSRWSPVAPPPKANCVFLTFAVRHRFYSYCPSWCLVLVSGRYMGAHVLICAPKTNTQ